MRRSMTPDELAMSRQIADLIKRTNDLIGECNKAEVLNTNNTRIASACLLRNVVN